MTNHRAFLYVPAPTQQTNTWGNATVCYDLTTMSPGEYLVIGRQPGTADLAGKLAQVPLRMTTPFKEAGIAAPLGFVSIDVSKNHALIVAGKASNSLQYLLMDLGSQNGTYVNESIGNGIGRKLKPFEPHVLENGTQFGLCAYLTLLRFQRTV
ncbi:FHA domain-containing protein [Candidatus Woesearchaeota archaeon]|nr:FHA domain-containing protein [Candidatus Woesearchaeota archaeon]